jgi:3-methyladenine DNA glycosylase AlkC
MMGEALKNSFDERVPRSLARQLVTVWPVFPSRRFLADVFSGYEELELMDRGRAIADALARHLPNDFPQALGILMESIDVPRETSYPPGGMASFYYLPHTSFIARQGLDHFDESMRAQHRLTQLFTAEFSIRPFIERYERESLALLREWAGDSNHHVRRLVSEGTRPRLPWGSRLPRFQKNPAPVIDLLELLKDDPELYVRRSVANNLNDIGKDHPKVLVAVAKRWMKGASADRKALVRHALRSLVKQGNADALAILGYGEFAEVKIRKAKLHPARVEIGSKVEISFEVVNTARRRQRLLVDFRIHFVKASGATSPKVFKLKAVELGPGDSATFRKTISLAELTTRKHYPGRHRVEALVNGTGREVGSFDVV